MGMRTVCGMVYSAGATSGAARFRPQGWQLLPEGQFLRENCPSGNVFSGNLKKLPLPAKGAIFSAT